MNEVDFKFRKHSITAGLTTGIISALSMFFILVFGNGFLIYKVKTITCILFGTMLAINIYFSKIVSITIDMDSIKITDEKTSKQTIFFKNNINNYNFNISKKGWLDILRVNYNGKNSYFWLGGMDFDKIEKSHTINRDNLLEKIEKNFPQKKITTIDSVIIFSGNKLPYIIAAISIGLLIAFLLVLVFILKD
ncbi:MAG: hypothetical protein Q4B94_07295 [Pseudomonadota bacterium]|nr:hypothetical protein [Pseudomonadota bacterium]